MAKCPILESHKRHGDQSAVFVALKQPLRGLNRSFLSLNHPWRSSRSPISHIQTRNARYMIQ